MTSTTKRRSNRRRSEEEGIGRGERHNAPEDLGSSFNKLMKSSSKTTNVVCMDEMLDDPESVELHHMSGYHVDEYVIIREDTYGEELVVKLGPVITEVRGAGVATSSMTIYFTLPQLLSHISPEFHKQVVKDANTTSTSTSTTEVFKSPFVLTRPMNTIIKRCVVYTDKNFSSISAKMVKRISAQNLQLFFCKSKVIQSSEGKCVFKRLTAAQINDEPTLKHQTHVSHERVEPKVGSTYQSSFRSNNTTNIVKKAECCHSQFEISKAVEAFRKDDLYYNVDSFWILSNCMLLHVGNVVSTFDRVAKCHVLASVEGQNADGTLLLRYSSDNELHDNIMFTQVAGVLSEETCLEILKDYKYDTVAALKEVSKRVVRLNLEALERMDVLLRSREESTKVRKRLDEEDDTSSITLSDCKASIVLSSSTSSTASTVSSNGSDDHQFELTNKDSDIAASRKKKVRRRYREENVQPQVVHDERFVL